MQQQMALYRTTKGFQQNHKSTALKCQNCNQEFLANRKTAKFCSSSCRSQFWMTKNKKKVITIAVPIDIDDAYLEKIKSMLENYKSTADTQEKMPLKSHHNEMFSTEKELRAFMAQAGFTDYKIPKHDLGIYYDEGLTIKKTEAGFEVKIMA
jgi:predicted transcriptional regulator YheO